MFPQTESNPVGLSVTATIPELQQSKTAVLNTLASKHLRRSYEYAIGEGEMRHIAHWQSVKLVEKSEEEEDGKTIIREKERFSNELTLVFRSGEIATLK